MYLRFLMTLELRYILVRLNYVWKLRYKMVIFSCVCFQQKNDKKIRNYYVICLLGTKLGCSCLFLK